MTKGDWVERRSKRLIHLHVVRSISGDDVTVGCSMVFRKREVVAVVPAGRPPVDACGNCVRTIR